MRMEACCRQCALRISGVGATEEESVARLENNLRVHFGSKRCYLRALDKLTWKAHEKMSADLDDLLGGPLR